MAGDIHLVSLSPQAVALLEQIHAITAYFDLVFISDARSWKPMSENTVNSALRNMVYDTKTGICGHGFRSMACSALVESGLWSETAIERQMSQRERNNVRAAYIHKAEFLEERRMIMSWWNRYLEANRQEHISPHEFANQTGANVSSLRSTLGAVEGAHGFEISVIRFLCWSIQTGLHSCPVWMDLTYKIKCIKSAAGNHGIPYTPNTIFNRIIQRACYLTLWGCGRRKESAKAVFDSTPSDPSLQGHVALTVVLPKGDLHPAAHPVTTHGMDAFTPLALVRQIHLPRCPAATYPLGQFFAPTCARLFLLERDGHF